MKNNDKEISNIETVLPEIDAETTSPEVHTETSQDTMTANGVYRKNSICGLLLMLCLVAWIFLPYAPLYNYQFSDTPPSAGKIVFGTTADPDDIFQSVPFWSAVGSLIGIAVSLYRLLVKGGAGVRTWSILTIALQTYLFIHLWNYCSWAYDAERTWDAVGLGFWCIFLIMLYVSFTVKNAKE